MQEYGPTPQNRDKMLRRQSCVFNAVKKIIKMIGTEGRKQKSKRSGEDLRKARFEQELSARRVRDLQAPSPTDLRYHATAGTGL